MTVILDGKKLANKILYELKKEAKGLPMKLAVVLVGNNSKSLKFIKQKQRAAKNIGAKFKLYKFNSKINNQNLTKKVREIIHDKTVTGIIIQLPLPSHINTEKILNLLPITKDVDALSVDNFLVKPPTASGIIKLIKEHGIEIKGKRVIIIGKGKLVGKPLAIMMREAGADLMVCDKKTKNLASQTSKADILISATGQSCLIKENMIKKGVVVIDAGTGDIDFENIKKKANYITPPIGGVGPMTVAMLMDNLIKLSKTNQ